MKRIIPLIATAIFCPLTFADIYLEPYVGYEVGTFKENIVLSAPSAITSDTSNTGSGVDFGGKVGFNMLGLAVGADYMHGSLKSNGNSDNADDIGAFVQYSIPMFKFSGTYFFSSKVASGGSTMKGSGYKVGVGYTALPLISINVDYVNISYNSADVSGATVGSFSASRGAVLGSVSVPLSF